MTIENLKLEQEKIIKEIENLKCENSTPIPDGIIDVEKYFHSNPKILWINKDVNSENDVDGWSLIDVLNDLPNVLTKEKGWNQTFNPIVYTLYGIFNKMEWEKIPFISEEPENCQCYKKYSLCKYEKTSRNKSRKSQ
ncbi:hypothetical protein [Chryseobacterium oryzae]|uniref:SEC-C motif-containing protein n=1 Tax=Chryseobacterium oryzae TaxID=2929799 RepID=A0ABY4BF48_9FLAO|nr:hypothetical protein [Chryseobacterium oryzae]UOE37680.1 hypothetical protein MTP08_11530 [Chryseobacterium oryzae]